LQEKIQDIQSRPDYIQGENDPHPGKPNPVLLAQVKKLLQQSTAKFGAWHKCELNIPGNLPNLNATFTGKATLTTSNGNAPGPFVKNVSLSLLFHEFHHTEFHITSFPPIVVGPFSVPGGLSNTTTITMTGTAQGTCNPSTGILKLPLSLHFHESNLFAGDSDLTVTLSTETKPGGSRMDAAGNISIKGTGVFQNGVLGGDTGTLLVKGKISPHP